MPSRHFLRRCRATMTATAKRGHRMRESRRILVVEDDFLVATLLAEIFESVGWQVVGPVAHLATALEAAASEGFDAATLDVNLGGQTVYPVAEVLDTRRVPFVFVTACGREGLPPLILRAAAPWQAVRARGVGRYSGAPNCSCGRSRGLVRLSLTISSALDQPHEAIERSSPSFADQPLRRMASSSSSLKVVTNTSTCGRRGKLLSHAQLAATSDRRCDLNGDGSAARLWVGFESVE
jgi:CheY-like chemotaxis protein